MVVAVGGPEATGPQRRRNTPKECSSLFLSRAFRAQERKRRFSTLKAALCLSPWSHGAQRHDSRCPDTRCRGFPRSALRGAAGSPFTPSGARFCQLPCRDATRVTRSASGGSAWTRARNSSSEVRHRSRRGDRERAQVSCGVQVESRVRLEASLPTIPRIPKTPETVVQTRVPNQEISEMQDCQRGGWFPTPARSLGC